jgi:small subunit ribosomal protein S1
LEEEAAMGTEDQQPIFTNEPPPLGEAWWISAMEDEEKFAGESDAEQEFLSGVHEEDFLEKKLDINWEYIDELYRKDEIIEAKVVGCNEGGLLVQGTDIHGFVPISHLIEQSLENKREVVGSTISLKVIECDRSRGRVVLSERAAQAKPGQRLELLNSLKIGDCVSGIVTTVTEFGAFIDLGGVEGLIHISELSWGRVGHPEEIVSEGEKVEVCVLEVDLERKRVALSLKKLCKNPWDSIQERYTPGQVVEAVITSVVSYGAFARIEEGVDGLIHVSEFGGNNPDKSSLTDVGEGQKVKVQILSMEPDKQRLGLSLHKALD